MRTVLMIYLIIGEALLGLGLLLRPRIAYQVAVPRGHDRLHWGFAILATALFVVGYPLWMIKGGGSPK